MRRVVIALVLCVALAGCGGLIGDIGQESTSTTEPGAITIADTDATDAGYNETMTVTIGLENPGDEPATETLFVELEDRDHREEVTLDPGANTTTTVEFDNLRLDQKTHTVDVTTDSDEQGIATDISHPSPYGSSVVRLWVDTNSTDRDVMPVVENATRYWENRSTEYLGYQLTYEIVDDRDDADTELTFGSVTQCGLHDPDMEYFGCAEIADAPVDGTVEARVQANLSTPYLLDTTKHELGHTLGLDHDDEPQVVMAEEIGMVERLGPVHIYINDEGDGVSNWVDDEIESAFEYVSDEAPENTTALEWTRVDDITEAHVVVTLTDETTTCGFDDGGSCIERGEYGGQQDLRLENIDHQTKAWHVGWMFWLVVYPDHDRPNELQADADRFERERFP